MVLGDYKLHGARGSVLRASIAQLADHALRKRMVAGSIPTGGSFIGKTKANKKQCSKQLQHQQHHQQTKQN